MQNIIKYIGLCCAEANKEPTKPIIDCLAERIAGDSPYRLLVFQCFEDTFNRSRSDIGGESVFSLINYSMLDALIIIPTSIYDKTVVESVTEECLKNKVPLISVDQKTNGAFSVCFGYGEAFGAIVDHLLTWHSCRRIKLIAGQKDNPFSQTRVDTCRRIMQQHDLPLDENDIYYCDFWDQPTFEAMDRFFESGEELPDVFICCNDTMAMAVCLKLNEHGISVPEDVLVSGFDGITVEKYHKPRLTTARRNNKELADELVRLLDEITDGDTVEPYDIDLSYEPVFSESCGCGCEETSAPNRQLAELVRSYSYALNFEEHINRMENRMAADPSPDNVRKVLQQYSFRNSVICVTDEFFKYCSGNVESEQGPFNGFGDMHVLVSSFDDGRKLDDMVFPAGRLIPQLESSFSNHNTLLIIPLHFQDSVQGYFVTHYVYDDHHNERLYTFCTSLGRCLENMRTHEHLSALNRRLEFMFTHDQLTCIYNRYGFYKGFRESYSGNGDANDVFIVSIDLNDMKYINDNFGHSAGDDALCITAKALTDAAEACGGGVICSRFGGDEFVAAKVCDGNAKEQAELYRKGFAEALDRLNETSGKPYRVHVGFGIYSASLSGVDSIDGLIELADRLMYSDKAKHKRHPRNGVT